MEIKMEKQMCIKMKTKEKQEKMKIKWKLLDPRKGKVPHTNKCPRKTLLGRSWTAKNHLEK